MPGENLIRELAELGPVVVRDPFAHVGAWRAYPCAGALTGGFAEVRADYGCGLGDFTVEMAAREPEVLFVGVEREAFCVVAAARKALEAGVGNAVFALTAELAPDEGDLQETGDPEADAGTAEAEDLLAPERIFAPGELGGIYLCFPTPYPRARDAAGRLTALPYLTAFRKVLAPDGFLRVKTDSQPLRDFTLPQLEAAGFELDWSVDDLRTVLPDDPVTGYERRLSGRGATVFSIQARPTAEPSATPPDTPASLYDYLPDDLDSLSYIPTDMERSVRNLAASRREIAARRAAREGNRGF